jgi:hypothetical protein
MYIHIYVYSALKDTPKVSTCTIFSPIIHSYMIRISYIIKYMYISIFSYAHIHMYKNMYVYSAVKETLKVSTCTIFSPLVKWLELRLVTYINIHINSYIHMYIHIYICIYIYTYVYTYIRIFSIKRYTKSLHLYYIFTYNT